MKNISWISPRYKGTCFAKYWKELFSKNKYEKSVYLSAQMRHVTLEILKVDKDYNVEHFSLVEMFSEQVDNDDI